jgi:uncharacterized protein
MLHLVAAFGLCLIFTKAANLLGFQVAEALYPLFSSLDPDRVFIELMIHHVFQGILAIGAIVLAGKFFHLRKEEFGFSRNQLPAALRAVFSFLLIWTVIQVSLSVAWIYLLKWEFSLPFNPTLWNTTGRILFQLGFSGPSEELLYRSLNLAVLLYFARKALASHRLATGLAVALSVVIFMVDHINFTLHPALAITHINFAQQGTTLIFGLFYAWLFLRYRTIYAPMVAHSLLNCVIELSAVLLFVTYPL